MPRLPIKGGAGIRQQRIMRWCSCGHICAVGWWRDGERGFFGGGGKGGATIPHPWLPSAPFECGYSGAGPKHIPGVRSGPPLRRPLVAGVGDQRGAGILTPGRNIPRWRSEMQHGRASERRRVNSPCRGAKNNRQVMYYDATGAEQGPLEEVYISHKTYNERQRCVCTHVYTS